MRSDRRKQEEANKRANKGTGFSRFTRLWAIIFLIASVLFGVSVVLANVLPSKYLLILGLALLLMLVIFFPPLYKKTTGKTARGIAFFLSLILTAVYLLGAWYLFGATGFLSKITNVNNTSEEYYVVVRDDDVFMKLEDIEGQTVYAYQGGKSVDQAISQLQNDVSVYVENSGDIEAMGTQLLAGDINVTLMNSAFYDGLTESIESFDDYTKILHKIKIKVEVEDTRKPVNVKDQSFNIYVTGIDTTGTIDVVARSDVNMIVTVNPSTNKVLMTSIPRDYYVNVPKLGAYDKLAHTGIYGSDCTLETVESLTGLDINYYVKVNFSTVELLVDAIGGIEVDSEYGFTSSVDGYYFQQGINYLNGHQALSFARERKSFTDGDFQRNKNQQLVLKAIISKMTKSTTLLTSFPSILGSLENNMETNMSSEEIRALLKAQTEDMPDWDIEQQSITGAVGSAQCYSGGSSQLSVVFIDQASVDAAVARIREVLAG